MLNTRQDTSEQFNSEVIYVQYSLMTERSMTDQLIGYLLLTISFFLFALCGASLVAMVQSLIVPDTVTAVESAFGTLVISVILLGMGKKTFSAGKKRIKSNG